MKFLARLLPLICFVILGLQTTASAQERSGNLYWAPPAITTGGEKIDVLMNFIFWLTLAVFIATQTVYIVYLIKYRRRPGHKAHYSHGNNTLEFWWTIIPTAVFLTLAIWGNRVWHDLTQGEIPPDAIQVDIVSYQYGFEFRYGGADGQLGRSDVKLMSVDNKNGIDPEDSASKDDFTSTELVIPVSKTVHVFLRSRDVIHSFYVPAFRLYQDAVPGRTIKWVHFTTTRTGDLELACNQLCGTGHYNMKAKIRILPVEEYEKWYAEKSAAALSALEDQPPQDQLAAQNAL
jgi:cytochrome c oxidase subunit 2